MEPSSNKEVIRLAKKKIRYSKGYLTPETRADRSLDLYLREIGETPLLTREEELEVARRIRQGDEASVDRLAKANLRFAVDVAKKYQRQGLSLADLINEGNIGLMKAAKRFDPERGYKFISYAVWWIRQAILQALAEQSRAVRLPLNRVGLMTKVKKQSALLEQSLGRLPDAKDIFGVVDANLQEISEALDLMERTLSLDAPIGNENGEESITLRDILTDDRPDPLRQLEEKDLQRIIAKALDSLPPRQEEIIRLYFGLDEDKGRTLYEIGQRFNLTRERIRQVKDKAILHLRHIAKRYLKDFKP